MPTGAGKTGVIATLEETVPEQWKTGTVSASGPTPRKPMVRTMGA